MPFDSSKDFIPVTKAGGSPNSWLVNPNLPAKTMKEMIDLFKKEPGKHSVGSPGAGTTPSLSIEMLKHALKLDFVTVPFAGGGPMTHVAARRPYADRVLGARQLVNLIKEGKLRGARGHRQEALGGDAGHPDAGKFGVMGQEAETMTGVFVPAGTPKPIVDKLHSEFVARGERPRHQGQLLQAGVEAEGNSQADFAAYIKVEVAKWKKAIEDANIKKIGS